MEISGLRNSSRVLSRRPRWFVIALAEWGYISQDRSVVSANMLLLLLHTGREFWAIAADDVKISFLK